MRRVVFFFLTLFIVNFVYAGTTTKTEEVKVDNLYYKLVTITETNDWVVRSRTRGVRPIVDEPDKVRRYALVASGHERYSGNITIPSVVQYGGKNYPVEGIGHAAFKDCVKLIKVTIPEGCDEIGDSAFYNCTLLAIVSLETESNSAGARGSSPISVSFDFPFIGRSAFESCVNLQSVCLPGNIAAIYDRAFANCKSIKSVSFTDADASVRIASTYNNIEGGYLFSKEIFAGCTGIETVYASRYVSPISEDTFDEKVYSNAQLICPEGDKEILKGKTGWKNFFNVIEYSLTPIVDSGREICSFNAGNFLGLSSVSGISLAAGTVIGETANIVAAIGANDTYKLQNFSANVNGYYLFGGLQGSTYPKDADSASPNVSLFMPVSGNFIKFSAKADGWLYVIINASSNNAYTVFEEGEALAYTFAAIGKKNPLPEVYSFTLHGDEEFDYLVRAGQTCVETAEQEFLKANIPTEYKNRWIAQNDGTMRWTNIAADGVGVIKFKVYTGCDYIVNANDSKFSAGGFVFSPEENVEIASDGITIIADTPVIEDVPNQDITYDFNTDNKTAAVTGITEGYTGAVIIPSNVIHDGKTYTVTEIDRGAFRGCSGLTSVTIPNSVTSIGKSAFSGCSSLTSVTIPNSVTSIGDWTFQNCSSLTSVTIPNSVTSIFYGAFYGCSGMTSVTIPNSVTSIGFEAFEDCSGLTSVTIPNSVTSIGNDAFRGCSGLTSVTIPNSVTSIGERAFAGCSSLTSVIIPNSVTSIFYGAFSGCSSLTSVTIPNSVTSIYYGAFRGCSGLTSVTIPNSVTFISKYAFSGCSGLTTVTIPNSVTYIDEFAFENCDGLTSVTSLISTPIYLDENTFSNYNIPLYVPSESVEAYKGTKPWSNFSPILVIDSTPSQNVGDTFKAQTKEGVWMTFKITSLEPKTCQVGDGENASIDVATVGKVTIPDTANDFKVTAIGSKGFYNCSKLTAIYLSENIESIGDLAFYGCTSLTTLDIPRSVKVISNTAFDNCGGSSGITINVSADNTSVIPSSNNVKVNITKPTDETTISLERVFIPKSVKNIGERSFSYCKSVIRMEVEEGHTIFDSRENCNAIIGTATNALLFGCQNTVIPETVTSIGAYAFEGHSNLKAITIPSGISSIGVNAFSSCEGLTNVISEIESPFAINDNTFDAQTYETAQLTVPSGTKEKYQNTAGWKNFINIVETDSEPITVKTVDITKAGTLANYISDSEKYTLTELKVTGYLNSTDFKLLRDMAGNNYLGNETEGKLQKLDLNGATIVKGGENYLETDWVHYKSGYGISTSGDALAIENENELGKDVFKGCKLQKIILPSSLTSIAESAFLYCLQLTNVTLPEGLLFIGESVFLGCEALSTLTIPSSVTTLGRYAFAYCNSLTSMTIPDGITTLEDNLFYDCRGLSSVVVPASVTSLKNQVFELCSSLTEVTVYRSAPPSTGYHSFTTQTNATLYVPKGSIDAYKAVEPWNKFKEIIPIYLTPIEKEVDYSGESSTVDENTDLCGTVIDNVYYNIGSDNGGFDADEKCLVVNKSMSDEEIEEVFGKDLFSDEVKENFTGIVIMAPAGKGKVAIDAQTTGGMTLMVKVGAADPIEMELEGKLKMKFPYDVTEPTYVYIYAGQNAAARTRAAEEPSLKIYGISLEKDILKGDANGDGVVNDADVKDVASFIMGKTPKGFNKDAADVNNDNKVNVADIVLINKIINKK